MSLIFEKHFLVLEYLSAALKVLEEMWNCSWLGYRYWTFENQD